MSYYGKNTNIDPLIFIHIPKTAGTSVENWFQTVYGKHNVVCYKHAPIWYNNLVNENAFKFSIVRNPFSRAVSFYQHALSLILRDEAIKKYQIKNLTMSEWEKGFENFLENFFSVIIRNPNDDIDISPSFSQWSYLSINDTLSVDKTIRFEDLNKEWINFEMSLGTNYGLSKLKVGPSDLLRDWKKVYTSTSRKFVEEIYKIDLDKFNYDF